MAVISIIEVTAFFVFSHPLLKYSIIVALLQSFEKSGNALFKYRGQIPALIFLLAIPILFFSNSDLYMQIFVGQRHFLRIFLTVVAILTSLSGLVLRAYTVSTTPKGTSGRNTAKQVANSLNTKGIYSVVRHPLYLANYLLWAGILIFSMNIWAFIIVSLVYWIYYERIMFAEEAFLRNKFGQEFEDWAATVPAFIPNWSLYEKGDMSFSVKTCIRREYVTVFSTIFCFAVVDYLMFYLTQVRWVDYHILSLNAWLRPSLYILVVCLILMLVIRTIKHHTKLLSADATRD